MKNRNPARITRRQLAGAVLATAAAAQAPSPPANPADELRAAREQSARTSEALAKVDVPMDTEPAFHFSA